MCKTGTDVRQANRGLKREANRADHIFTESEPLLDALLAAATAIEMKAPQTALPSQSQLLAWRGALYHSDTEISDLAMAATTLFERGLDELIAARAKKGIELQAIVRRELEDVGPQSQQLES